GGLDEQDASATGIDVAEVTPQRVPCQLGDLAGHLDAGGAGADDDEREPGVPRRCVWLALGGLEGGEESAANGECTLERLERCRPSSWPKSEYCEPPATISVS